MYIDVLKFRIGASRSDYKRDRIIPIPAGVTQCRSLSYGKHGKWSLLDVYYPVGTKEPLPTIVSIHGGGFIYGTKEVYRRYCMDLARRGFTVVNFNYRLAPEWKFPSPLEDTNAVLAWICDNAKQYHLDPKRLFLVGDSAGAQLASQYAAIASNEAYAAHFSFRVPEVHIRAVGLNCGVYILDAPDPGAASKSRSDYLGPLTKEDPRLQVLDAVTENYPAAYITTGVHDFLRDAAEPMYDHLTSRGVRCAWKCYGQEDNKRIGHVFHVNILFPEAKQCNDETCAFFLQQL